MTIATLRALHPWPDAPPNVPPDPHGFLVDSTAELLRRHLTPETKLVIELGSWLGTSTRLILDSAPNATVIAIDHWRGPLSMRRPHMRALRDKIPTLYETFLRNCWEYRDRLIPLRMSTAGGMIRCSEHGIKPDVIFIDADHSYAGVTGDLWLALGFSPGCTIIGDDWLAKAGKGELRRAVKRVAKQAGYKIETHGNGWRLVR